MYGLNNATRKALLLVTRNLLEKDHTQSNAGPPQDRKHPGFRYPKNIFYIFLITHKAHLLYILRYGI